jgi:hypothetical protein
MTRQLRSIAFGLFVLALASLACALPNFSGSNAPASEPGANSVEAKTAIAATVAAGGEAETQDGKAGTAPTATIEPTATVPPTPTQAPELPVGLRQGLASLNSYKLRTVFIVNGPTAQDINRETTEFAYNADGDRTHTHIEALISSADDPSTETNIRDQYRIGTAECSLPASDEGESPLSSTSPIQQEMNEAMVDLTDFVIFVKDPELVGEETVNGVATRHYRFVVTALGKKSGAEVTQSAGEYWTAVDGNYLVKYSLILETHSAPQENQEAQVMHAEILLDLTEINQPVSIEMPAECK